jgi:hypothetical protein
MQKQDGLTVINSQPLISPEKIQDKTLDQMTLPERADLLREAYQHINGDDATTEELEVIGMMETKVEEKLASWGLVVQKITEAADLCKVEADYYQQKVNDAKARGERFQKKIDAMGDFIKAKMIEFNKKKIETPLFTVSLRKKPQKVEISESASTESPEHPDFVLTTVSRRWDKKAIKDKLSEGQLFESVRLSEPDFSILIKGS